MEKYISTLEASKIMGVSDSFVRRLCRTGQIEHIKVGSTYAVGLKAAKNFVPKRTKNKSKD